MVTGRLRMGLAALILALASAHAAAAPSPQLPEALAAAKRSMMSDPAAALRQADAALALSAEPGTGHIREQGLAAAEARWLKAEALTRLYREAEARPLVTEALAVVRQAAPYGKLHGDLLMTDAAIAGATGKIRGALGNLLAAHRIFQRVGETRSQALALHDIGSIYAEAGDHARAVRYYRQSAEAHDSDPGLLIPLYNNIGSSLRETGQARAAAAEFRKALALARGSGTALRGPILVNIGSAELEAGNVLAAERSTNAAATLLGAPDAASWRPFLAGVQAQIALARGQLPRAATLLDQSFAGGDLRTTTLPYREFHRTAYQVHGRLGDTAKALAHLEAYKRLEDEAHSVTASASAALMTAQFDFANQELRIAKLKTETLERDVQLARSRERLDRIILWSMTGGLVVAVLVALGSLLSFLSIRRSRNRVREANRELASTNVQLEQALTAKTRFLATTSHEIRTPLNGILGMAQVMLHDRSLHDDHRQRLRVLQEAGQTMKALVDDILDVAKIEQGKLQIAREEVALKPLMNEVARLWTTHAAAKGLRVAASLADCPERITGDPRRLRQIVFNLMSNAVKFTQEGTVTLTVAADEPAGLVISVSDTGIGIPADQLDRIFESFHQVDGELTRQHGGSGLGLAICAELAEAMGGTLTVQSRVGEGSVFTVRLPVEIIATQPKSSAGPWPDELKQADVLIVDNNPLSARIIAAALDGKAGSVRCVSLAAAEAATAEQRYHHLVADGRTLGADAHKWIAARLEAHPGTHVVLICNGSPPAPLAAERVTVLVRPVAHESLLAALGALHAAALAA